jgi:hypothetical protein
MQTASTFTDAGWDFVGESQNGVEEIWAIRQGWCSPYLAWQDSCNPDDDLPADIGLCVSKSKIKAGRSRGLDSFAFSGTMGVWQANFARASTISVSLLRCTDDMIVFSETIGIEAEQLKRGTFRYKGRRGGLTKLEIDVNRRRFSVSGSHIDLGGLSSPMVLEIKIGDCPDRDRVSEAVINGRRPIPMQLLNGYDDALRVDKIKAKKGKKPSTDSFSVKGGFSLMDEPSEITSMTLSLGGQPFVIPDGEGAFTYKRNKSTSKITSVAYKSDKGVTPQIKAKFDFVKCSYSVSIKKTELETTSGQTTFGVLIDMTLSDSDYNESVPVDLD